MLLSIFPALSSLAPRNMKGTWESNSLKISEPLEGYFMLPLIWLAYSSFWFFLPLKITSGVWIRCCIKNSEITQTSRSAFNMKVESRGFWCFLFQTWFNNRVFWFLQRKLCAAHCINATLFINATIFFLSESICTFHYFCSYMSSHEKTMS